MFDTRKQWAKLAIASALFISAVTAAFALNMPSTANFSARQNTTQQTNYYRFTINYNDPRISTGVKFGRLPASAFVSAVKCHLGAAFNATSTNVVTVGYDTSSINQIIAAGDLNEASAQFQNLTSAAGLGIATTSAGEIDLYARYTQTGTAASAGSATCVLEYVPNNDQ